MQTYLLCNLLFEYYLNGKMLSPRVYHQSIGKSFELWPFNFFFLILFHNIDGHYLDGKLDICIMRTHLTSHTRGELTSFDSTKTEQFSKNFWVVPPPLPLHDPILTLRLPSPLLSPLISFHSKSGLPWPRKVSGIQLNMRIKIEPEVGNKK